MGDSFESIARQVIAVIPSRQSLHLLMEDGQLPSAPHASGTYEDTLATIGHRVLDRAISPDWAFPRRGGIIYLAKAVDHRVETLRSPDAEWTGMAFAEASHDGTRDYWKQYILDAFEHRLTGRLSDRES